jgi:hypothetical protein
MSRGEVMRLASLRANHGHSQVAHVGALIGAPQLRFKAPIYISIINYLKCYIYSHTIPCSIQNVMDNNLL